MEKEDVRPGGLSSLRDGAAEASPPKASIPDAAARMRSLLADIVRIENDNDLREALWDAGVDYYEWTNAMEWAHEFARGTEDEYTRELERIYGGASR